MARSLLILMLMTTQLLAGSSGSVYLCISNDGSYCCFDTGPDSCTCCHDEQKEVVRHTCCGGCEKDGDHALWSHHEEGQPVCLDDIFVAGDPCGCTHIPVVMSSDQPTNVVRSSSSVDGERLISLIAVLPTLVFDHHVTAHPPLRRADPPELPDFALTVVSTVVIRC